MTNEINLAGKCGIDAATAAIISALPADTVMVVELARTVVCELYHGAADTFINAYLPEDYADSIAAMLSATVETAKGFEETQAGISLDVDAPVFMLPGEDANMRLDAELQGVIDNLPPDFCISMTIGRGGWDLSLMQRSATLQRLNSSEHEPLSQALQMVLQEAKRIALGGPVEKINA